MENILRQKAASELEHLFKKYGVPVTLVGDLGSDWSDLKGSTSKLVKAILGLTDLTTEEVRWIMNGMDKALVKCDGEYKYPTGWESMMCGYKVRFAVDTYIRRKLQNSVKTEVGMKYPVFNKKQFIKKFDLTLVGVIEPESSKLFRAESPGSRKIEYETYTDKQGNVYSFEPGRMGKGGYAGFCFVDKETAFSFVKWFLGVKSHYVKDVDLLINRLGGLRWDEWTAWQEESITLGYESV